MAKSLIVDGPVVSESGPGGISSHPTTDKVNATTATVKITDGSNTVDVISADLTDAPCNIAISFAGHWQTWKACRVDLVTTGVVTATLALGYFRIPWDTAMGYGEWDALR